MADAGAGDSVAGSLPPESVLNQCPHGCHWRGHLSEEQKAKTTLSVIRGYLSIFCIIGGVYRCLCKVKPGSVHGLFELH